jgi:hypothetical protein
MEYENAMKNCDSIQTFLPLFDSKELTAIEKRQVDDHLATCNRCREKLAAIRALHADLQRVNIFEPDETMLADLRRDLRRRLQREILRPSWQERLANLFLDNLRPAWQFGFAAAMLVIGILIGRYWLSSPGLGNNKSDVMSYLTSGKELVFEQGYVTPSLADVQMIRIDPVTKQVEIHLNTVNDVQLRGNIDDPSIQQALSFAMRDERQPNLRLKAIKAIGETYVSSPVSSKDDELTDALLYVLENDPNAGVRLKAAQVLKHFPLNGMIKNALIRALLRDENSAVRITAIEALNRGRFSEDELAIFQATAAADTNDYVRLKAQRLLSEQLKQAIANPEKNQIQ